MVFNCSIVLDLGDFSEPIDRKPILDENSMPIMENDGLITSEGTKIKVRFTF